MFAAAFRESIYFLVSSACFFCVSCCIRPALACSNEVVPASLRSVTLMIWYPKRVSTTSLIFPVSSANAALSKGGTIRPLPKKPKSPPFAAEPGSAELALANAAKSAPSFICLSRSSAFALACAFAWLGSVPISSFGLISI